MHEIQRTGFAVDYSQPLSDAEFRQVVDFELDRGAQKSQPEQWQEARDYLEAPENRRRWLERLTEKFLQTGDRLGRLKEEKRIKQEECLRMGSAGYRIWVSYNAEMQQKMGVQTRFLHVVQMRLTHIKSLKVQEAQQQQLRDPREDTFEAGWQEGFRKGYRLGYGHAWREAGEPGEVDVVGIQERIEEHLRRRGA